MILLALAAASLTTISGPIGKGGCPIGYVCAWEPASIVRGLQIAGYKAEIADDHGKPYLISATNGNDFSVDYYNCDDEVKKIGCTTLMLGSYYPPQPYLNIALANTYNRDALFGRAYVDDKGRLQFTFPITTIGGLPQAQFKAQIKLYSTADADLGKLVAKATETAKKPD